MTGAGGKREQAATPPLALTMGEPAGIGGEIALMAWRTAQAERTTQAERSDASGATLPPFFIIDDPARLAALALRIGADVPLEVIAKAAEARAVFPRALPVLPLDQPFTVQTGQPDPANAGAVLESIQRAVALTQNGQAAALVTNPIHKDTLYQAGFEHPGHTEYLGALAGLTKAGATEIQTPVMMLACPGLRVVPVTVHLPLAQVARELTSAAIIHAARVTTQALRQDFGIPQPRLAVAGLNPHAGEGGALGREEIDIIIPAIEALRRENIQIEDPAPADSLFHAARRETYDAALCMYHDQALIPLKTIDFMGGVNITLGLPFIRTSPDHGTAFGLAGSGRADPASLIAALKTAHLMAAARAGADQRSVA